MNENDLTKGDLYFLLGRKPKKEPNLDCLLCYGKGVFLTMGDVRGHSWHINICDFCYPYKKGSLKRKNV